MIETGRKEGDEYGCRAPSKGRLFFSFFFSLQILDPSVKFTSSTMDSRILDKLLTPGARSCTPISCASFVFIESPFDDVSTCFTAFL